MNDAINLVFCFLREFTRLNETFYFAEEEYVILQDEKQSQSS